ncbi:MAG: SpoIVB peptidase [Oscillospiraceae bacterium]|nr:SpoIVB peptidase [Oscillospiraceae bacterium]
MGLFGKTAKILASAGLIVCTLLWSAIAATYKTCADNYFVTEGQSLEVSQYVKAVPLEESLPSNSAKDGRTVLNELKLLGIFPIKTVAVSTAAEKCVVPGGIPFGIKMISDGVMVTAVSAINCSGKLQSPARDVGIKSGDVIVSINGEIMRSNADVVSAVNMADGAALKVTVRHQNGNTEQMDVKAAFDPADKSYKLGIWVRDSSAGIGTVTFYDPQSGIFGGLGHAVCDSDTGNALTLLEGEIVGAEIDGVTKGKNGAPGQLSGHFSPFAGAGNILKNDDTGVYGTLNRVKVLSQAIPVAFKQDIKTGKATILTTISGTEPEEYEIEIERICTGVSRLTKNMVVHITDKRLLNETGGIVQGMSGSPILQDGKLVGAISHVFVNDPARGYAIFAENMLESAQGISEKQLNKAS